MVWSSITDWWNNQGADVAADRRAERGGATPYAHRPKRDALSISGLGGGLFNPFGGSSNDGPPTIDTTTAQHRQNSQGSFGSLHPNSVPSAFELAAREAANPRFKQQAEAGKAPSDGLGAAEARLASQLQSLDSQFNAQRDQLRGMFQLAETPQEQALLAFQLGDLEEQRKAGTTIIANEYGKASGFAGSQAGKMRDTATAEGEARGEIYSEAAGRAGDAIDQLAGEHLGSGLGVGAVPVSGDATDWVGLLEAAAPREQALATNLGNIAADDMQALGAQLKGEGSAQSGALQRAALGLRADATIQHQQQVAQRLAAEQSAFRQALMGLQGQQFDRQFQLEDRQFDLEMHRADQAQQGQGAGPDGAANPNEYQNWNDFQWGAWFASPDGEGTIGPALQGMYGPTAQRVASAIQQQAQVGMLGGPS